jgi:hypothetical protein
MYRRMDFPLSKAENAILLYPIDWRFLHNRKKITSILITGKGKYIYSYMTRYRIVSDSVIKFDDDVNWVRLRLWTAGLFSSSQVIYEQTRWNDIDTVNSESSRALWQFYQQSSSINAGETGEENKTMNLSLRIIFVHTSKGSWTCRKILRYGADGFTSPPKEGVLRIFIAFKTSSPQLGLNQQTLGPMRRTLTITPLMTTKCSNYLGFFFSC